MITINNKFEIGQEVFAIKSDKITVDCPICNGMKKVEYNGYKLICPHCKGAGKLETNSTIPVVVEEKCTVRCIRVTFHDEDNYSVRYKIDSWCPQVKNRIEDNLFATKDEAQEYCNKLLAKRVELEE